MKHIVTALALMLCITAGSGASIPPPPPGPPGDLPESYDGYSTEALWYAYIYWVRGEAFARRERAFDALDLPAYSANPKAWQTALEGPSYVSTSYWIPHGNHFAFERICPPDVYEPASPDCQWRYRSAFYDARDSDIHAIARDTFDGAAFAAWLDEAGIPADAVTTSYRSDFGQAGTVHARLDALIVTRDVREAACPAVGTVIADLAGRSVPLSPFERPRDPNAPPAPPPLPPGSDNERLTFPLGFFPDTEAELTLEAAGSPWIGAYVSALVGPVRACIEAAEG